METNREPREGLPLCIRGLEIYDGYQACWHDMNKCPKPVPAEKRYVITAGLRWAVDADDDCTNGAVRGVTNPIGLLKLTDDSSEAEAAFEQAKEWLRTGGEDEDEKDA